MQGIVADLAKLLPHLLTQALDALPSSRIGTHLEQAKENFLGERSATLSEKGTGAHMVLEVEEDKYGFASFHGCSVDTSP